MKINGIKKIFNERRIIWFIPFILVVWSLLLVHISGPFYINRIDPEFPYLLNGLSSANFYFSRLGLVEHPGIPFHLLTGFFILITYWIAGQGPLVDDVISRPEMYLTATSFQLTLITAFILLWLGKMVMNINKDVFGALILQSSLFLSVFLIDLSCRYIPDRMLALIAITFTGICFKYFYYKHYSGKKFAIISGILLGVGFVTKFNFLPLFLIPVFVLLKWKERFIYIGVFSLSSIISFFPVYDKFSYFRNFITSLIKHDGLYGGGSEKVFNPDTFWHNFKLIFQNNLSFTVVIGMVVFLIIIFIIKPLFRKQNTKPFFFFLSMICVTLIGTIMTAKHFKEYYMIPVVSFTGFAFLLVYKTAEKIFSFRFLKPIFVFFLIGMILIPATYLYHPYLTKKQRHYNDMMTAEFINKNVAQTDYFLVEPTWLSGGMIENGMAYGLSYIAYRSYYYNEFERYYPNALTWNGKNEPLQYLKMIEANNEAIFKSGRSIFIYSTPGRNADLLCNYIDSCSLNFGILFQRDTVYKNRVDNNFIIRLKNKSGWNEKLIGRFGFEKFNGNTLFSDDGKYTLSGQFNLSDICASNGYHSLILSENHPKSPELQIQKISQGDYFEVTVKRKRNDNDDKGNLLLCSTKSDGKFYKIAEGQFVSVIHSDWELLRLSTDIHEIPENGTLTCFYEYKGDAIEFIDDFTLKYFSNKPD